MDASVLQDGYILFDGAIGTMLGEQLAYGRGVHILSYPDLVSAYYPTVLKKLHVKYLEAGADVITTNTMLCCQPLMDRYQLKLKPKELIQESVLIAREAIEEVGGKDRYIAGSIGPLMGYIEDMELEDAQNIVREKASYMLEAGVDLLLLETQLTMEELDLYVEALEDAVDDFPGPTRPIQVHVAPIDEIQTPREASLSDMFKYLEESENVLAYGANCVTPDLVLSIASTYLSTEAPVGLALMPNSGNGETMPLQPEHFAELMENMSRVSRARIIGGCCGTTPAHTKVLASKFPLVNALN